MRYKVLGKTGLFVSEFCLGTMTFGQSAGRYAAASGVGQADADLIIRTAFEAGVNLIDTANVYANGQAEEIVGQALKNERIPRHKVHLATKAEHATGNGPNEGGGSRVHIMEEVKKSLKRLGTDYIDLYQLHGWDPATPVEETLMALNDLVRAGHIRYIGVSNWAAWQMTKALRVCERTNLSRIQSYQGYYSLVGRDLEREIVPMVESEQVGLLVYSPLAGGFLTGKYRDENASGRRKTIPFPPIDENRGRAILEVMDPIAKKHNLPMEAIALSWLLHQPAVTSVVAGVKSVAQLQSNLKASSVKLGSEELAALGAVSQLSPEYPGWMVASSDAARLDFFKTGYIKTN